MNNGRYDFSTEAAYFVPVPPATTGAALMGGSGLLGSRIDGVTSHLVSNSPNYLLAGLVLGVVAWAYWTRGINR